MVILSTMGFLSGVGFTLFRNNKIRREILSNMSDRWKLRTISIKNTRDPDDSLTSLNLQPIVYKLTKDVKYFNLNLINTSSTEYQTEQETFHIGHSGIDRYDTHKLLKFLNNHKYKLKDFNAVHIHEKYVNPSDIKQIINALNLNDVDYPEKFTVKYFYPRVNLFVLYDTYKKSIYFSDTNKQALDFTEWNPFILGFLGFVIVNIF